MSVGAASNSTAAARLLEFQAEAKNKGQAQKLQNHPPKPECPCRESQSNPENEGEKVRGVIRLLQEGHFKGVADVRLRINFHDELQAMEDAGRAEMVSGEIERFEQEVSGRLDSFLLAPIEPGGEGKEPAAEALREALVIFNQTKGQFSSDPAEDLTQRFDNLLTAIRGFGAESAEESDSGDPAPEEVLPDPALIEGEEPVAPEEEPVEPMAAEEPGPTETASDPVEAPVPDAGEEQAPEVSVWDSLANELQGLFDDFMAGLEEKSSTFSVLPELSAPTGHGRAYEKFLAIYQSLGAEPPALDAQPEVQPDLQPESVDLLV